MSMMHAVSEFLLRARDLYHRMRSMEGATLSKGDLQVLMEQLQLLHAEATNLLNKKDKTS